VYNLLQHRDFEIKKIEVIMISQNFFLSLAKERDLSTSAKTILFFIMGSSDAESYIFFKQKDLSDELKIDKSEVCKALKILMNKGIIAKAGNVSAYKLNPDYGLNNSTDETNYIKKTQMIAMHA
jgi:DNA replication protein DnaD